MLHIIRCAWARRIDCKWPDVSIGSQSRDIAKKLQMTSDDVIMTPGDLAQVTGENLHVGYHVWPDEPCLWNSWTVSTKNDDFENSPIDLALARSKIDLTLGHGYQNSEIYESYLISSSLSPVSLKSIGWKLWPVCDVEYFRRWGYFAWPGDLTSHDLRFKLAHNMWKICTDRCAKFGGAVRRRFPAISEKP